jgi:hypothetical protein
MLSILKGSDDGVMHFEESGFGLYPSSNIFFFKKQLFGSWL